MIIIGLNAYHGDASACLIRGGRIIAAAEEERFRRIKHWAGFPSQAIRYCLQEAGVALEDVSHIAINSDPKAALLKKIGFTLKRRPDPGLILERLRNQKDRHSIEAEIASAFPGAIFKGTIHRVEHHIAHMASAFLVSPFKEAVTVSIDGFGDFSSAAWGIGQGTAFTVDGRVYFPHSLGIFYQALTQYLGFPHYGDEYKVMGLAPYGKPNHMDAMRQIVRLKDDGSFELDTKYFRHHKEKIDYAWAGGSPVVGTLYSAALSQLLGPVRANNEPLTQNHFDIARSTQAMYEEAFFNLLDKLHQRYGVDTLALAGGCAMNSVANGKIRRNTPFKKLYIQSAAGDAGGAIGAALQVWHSLNTGVPAQPTTEASALAGDDITNRAIMDHAYLGPNTNNTQINELICSRADELEQAQCDVRQINTEEELFIKTAQAISDGKVIGWFQGRMEWGPRALGNRSILCDPRRADMKEILNQKIKRRESFRPFAPSILREEVSAWFEEDDDVPFMMQVYQIREDKRAAIPAVTHVDGSGRLQTVHKQTNPRYYGLIKTFQELTGVPMLLNTSFNENEPVVCLPQEALDCFLRTKMDVLVMGDMYINRRA